MGLGGTAPGAQEQCWGWHTRTAGSIQLGGTPFGRVESSAVTRPVRVWPEVIRTSNLHAVAPNNRYKDTKPASTSVEDKDTDFVRGEVGTWW